MKIQELQKIIKKITDPILQNIAPNSKIILGFSGGPDSVFLLEMLMKIYKKANFTIIASHLNHSLRGIQSDRDEEFCHQKISGIAEAKIIFARKKIDIKKIAQKNAQGLEEIGRKARYDFFRELAQKHHARHILTAHHANDNLETIIFNLSRGGGLKALCGIQLEKTVDSISYLRPLIYTTKKEIIDYLKFFKIKFRTDKSNNNEDFTRNFIRKNIVPDLEKLNPNISATMTRNSRNSTEIESFMRYNARDWIKKNSKNKNKSRFPLKVFRKLPPALQKYVLFEIYFFHCGNLNDIEDIHIQEVLKIIEQNIGSKEKKMGKLKIKIQNSEIIITWDLKMPQFL